jgi:hypothetical protein
VARRPALLDEADLRADLQLGEPAVQDAVLVEVDLPPVGRLEEAVAAFRDEPGDLGVEERLTSFDLAPLDPGAILQLAPRLVEGVADLEVEVPVLRMLGRVAPHHDLFTGDLQVNADLVEVALLVMAMRDVDDDAAAHDPVVEFVQPLRLRADLRIELFRWGKVVKDDLLWESHGRLLLGLAGRFWPSSRSPSRPKMRMRCNTSRGISFICLWIFVGSNNLDSSSARRRFSPIA